uniref:Reverse transcriptase domain-containing protein n=1 Tax=Cyprinus carpio TaxID=7962 RepID=A0A8C2FGS7_CYPCA
MLCEENFRNIKMEGNIEEKYNKVVGGIISAANQTIPLITGNGKKKKNVPWWSEECSVAVKERNKAFRVLKRVITQDTVIEYQKKRATARKVIKSAKRKAWQEFCNTIGRETGMNVVWRMIRKMNGVNSCKKIPVIEEEGKVAITNKEKTEVLAKTFSKVHSIENLSDKFLNRRQELSRIYENVHEKKQGAENSMDEDFNAFELKIAINNSKNTTPGKDMITYNMLKNLPEIAIKTMLDLYNHIWNEGYLPKDWKSAIVIPVVKPGKDATKSNSYRPIALTSTLCKVMEKMLVRRLNYFLEKKEILTPVQCGFRKKRTTMDALLLFENEVRKALIMKEFLVAVFFDIEKAYDTLWREGLLIKLDRIGVGGRMYNWILDFLFERTFQVRIGEETSASYDILNGTPQGSVISPILFNLMINDIFEKVKPSIGKALYADDGAIWKRGRNIGNVIKGVQETINEVERWSVDWGMKFSVSKTQYMVFSRKKKIEQITLKLYDQLLERVIEFKYLGLIFDEKMTWKQHIKKIENKCKRVINCMTSI